MCIYMCIYTYTYIYIYIYTCIKCGLAPLASSRDLGTAMARA